MKSLTNLFFNKKRDNDEYNIIKSAVEIIDPEYTKHIAYFNSEDQRDLLYKRIKYFATSYHELEAENNCLKLELNKCRIQYNKKR